MRGSLALVLAASAVCGCYSEEIVTSRSEFARSKATQALLLLHDGTNAHFAEPYLDGDLVRGRVSACAGISCDTIRRSQSVSFDQVSEIRIRRLSEGNTNVAVAVIGGVLLVGAVVAIVVANSSKNQSSSSGSSSSGSSSSGGSGSGTGTTGGGFSCPLAYSWDGHQWKLDSGTYGGSHFSAAQRTDYDLLEYLAPVDGKYRLRLVNALPESEYTDAVAIRVVDHPAGTRVVPDLSGKLLTFRDAQLPLSATDLRGRDALAFVAARDGNEWRSDLSDRRPDRAGDTRDGLVVEFAKPPGAKRAKLWMAGRNTPWSVHMVETMLSQQGPNLAAWYAGMNASAEARRSLFDFMVREGMLVVDVRTGDGWARRGFYWDAGPEIRKDQAIEIPVADVPGDRLTLRLDAPVAFWSIDSLAVAYDDDDRVEVRTLAPRSAIADGGRDLTQVLSSVDDDRFATRPGDRAEIVFDAPPPPALGTERSYVLVTTGYYVPDITPDPRADPKETARIMATPGAAARMSLESLNTTLVRELLR